MDPIKDDLEFVLCLRAILRYEEELCGRFLIEPEDPLARYCLRLRRLVRDYLGTDKRLDGA